jgi:hypothetical protein
VTTTQVVIPASAATAVIPSNPGLVSMSSFYRVANAALAITTLARTASFRPAAGGSGGADAGASAAGGSAAKSRWGTLFSAMSGHNLLAAAAATTGTNTGGGDGGVDRMAASGGAGFRSALGDVAPSTMRPGSSTVVVTSRRPSVIDKEERRRYFGDLGIDVSQTFHMSSRFKQAAPAGGSSGGGGSPGNEGGRSPRPLSAGSGSVPPPPPSGDGASTSHSPPPPPRRAPLLAAAISASTAGSPAPAGGASVAATPLRTASSTQGRAASAGPLGRPGVPALPLRPPSASSHRAKTPDSDSGRGGALTTRHLSPVMQAYDMIQRRRRMSQTKDVILRRSSLAGVIDMEVRTAVAPVIAPSPSPRPPAAAGGGGGGGTASKPSAASPSSGPSAAVTGSPAGSPAAGATVGFGTTTVMGATGGTGLPGLEARMKAGATPVARYRTVTKTETRTLELGQLGLYDTFGEAVVLSVPQRMTTEPVAKLRKRKGRSASPTRSRSRSRSRPASAASTGGSSVDHPRLTSPRRLSSIYQPTVASGAGRTRPASASTAGRSRGAGGRRRSFTFAASDVSAADARSSASGSRPRTVTGSVTSGAARSKASDGPAYASVLALTRLLSPKSRKQAVSAGRTNGGGWSSPVAIAGLGDGGAALARGRAGGSASAGGERRSIGGRPASAASRRGDGVAGSEANSSGSSDADTVASDSDESDDAVPLRDGDGLTGRKGSGGAPAAPTGKLRARGAVVNIPSPATVMCDSHVDLLIIPREALFACTSFATRQAMRDFAIKSMRRAAAAESAHAEEAETEALRRNAAVMGRTGRESTAPPVPGAGSTGGGGGGGGKSVAVANGGLGAGAVLSAGERVAWDAYRKRLSESVLRSAPHLASKMANARGDTVTHRGRTFRVVQ